MEDIIKEINKISLKEGDLLFVRFKEPVPGGVFNMAQGLLDSHGLKGRYIFVEDNVELTKVDIEKNKPILKELIKEVLEESV